MKYSVKDKQYAVPQCVSCHANVFPIQIKLGFVIELTVVFQKIFGIFHIAAGFTDWVFYDFLTLTV